MNSLQDLNGYNNTLELPFTDNRLGTVFFDRVTPNNRTQIVNEGSTFAISMGIEITDIAKPESSAPVFRITVSNLFGTTVTWSNLPANLTVTNPDPGVYEVSGLETIEDWIAIKQGVITIPGTVPNGYTGNWTYGCSISYYDEALGNQSKSWTVAVSVLDVVILTNPFDFIYNVDSEQTITNTPQISDLPQYSGATWTIVATPSTTGSIVSFDSNYTSGGTFTYNPTTKAFTIVGTRTQVNGHLNAISFTSSSIAVDFNLSYELTNNVDQAVDNKTQFLKNANILYLTNPEIFYYTEDSVSQRVIGTSQITDTSYTGEETYTVTVTPNNITYVDQISTTFIGGTVNFNTLTKVFTITGTKTEVNNVLANLYITTAADVDQVFSLTYSLVTPTGNTASKVQTLLCGSNDTEVTNMNITRTYKGNSQNFIFTTSTPSITDFDADITNVYTVFFSSALGQFELAQSVNPYVPGTLYSTLSISGTREEINNAFSRVAFYPTVNVSANGSFTYEQQKNGVRQILQQVALQNDGTTEFTNKEIEFTSTQTWTPNYSDVLYGKISKILVVGAGGGGGFYGNEGGGGGAGGDVIVNDNNYSLNLTPATTYNITVGVGGIGGKNTITPATAGGNTSAFDITANGGAPGTLLSGTQPRAGGGSKSIINGVTFGPFTAGLGIDFNDNTTLGGPGGSGSAANGNNSSNRPSIPLPGPGNNKGGVGVTYNGKNNWYGHGGHSSGVSFDPNLDGWQIIIPQTGDVIYKARDNSGIGGIGGGGDGIGVNVKAPGYNGGSGYVKIWITAK